MGNPPVGPIGGMMPPQPGIPPQQQGMRPPIPPHGNNILWLILIKVKHLYSCHYLTSKTIGKGKVS